jgi:hypothetical protein
MVDRPTIVVRERRREAHHLSEFGFPIEQERDDGREVRSLLAVRRRQ